MISVSNFCANSTLNFVFPVPVAPKIITNGIFDDITDLKAIITGVMMALSSRQLHFITTNFVFVLTDLILFDAFRSRLSQYLQIALYVFIFSHMYLTFTYKLEIEYSKTMQILSAFVHIDLF